MSSVVHQFARRGAAVACIAAFVQGGLVGMVMAVHAAHDDHTPVDHDDSVVELIVHGHNHDPGTPEHEHSFVSAKPTPQHLKRNDLPDPPQATSSAVLSSALTIPLSLHRRTQVCGPSPPSLNSAFVVLRI